MGAAALSELWRIQWCTCLAGELFHVQPRWCPWSLRSGPRPVPMHDPRWGTQRAEPWIYREGFDPHNWFGTQFGHRGSVGLSVVTASLSFHRSPFHHRISSHQLRVRFVPPERVPGAQDKEPGTQEKTSSTSRSSALRQERLGQTTVNLCPPKAVEEGLETQAVQGRPGQTSDRHRLDEPEDKKRRTLGAQELHRRQTLISRYLTARR